MTRPGHRSGACALIAITSLAMKRADPMACGFSVIEQRQTLTEQSLAALFIHRAQIRYSAIREDEIGGQPIDLAGIRDGLLHGVRKLLVELGISA
jgi:hypothetical protein